MKKIFHTVTMAALLVAATSCEHKELCLDHAHAVEVEVVFDWRNAPNAAPASMSLYLFPGDGEAQLLVLAGCRGDKECRHCHRMEYLFHRLPPFFSL